MAGAAGGGTGVAVDAKGARVAEAVALGFTTNAVRVGAIADATGEAAVTGVAAAAVAFVCTRVATLVTVAVRPCGAPMLGALVAVRFGALVAVRFTDLIAVLFGVLVAVRPTTLVALWLGTLVAVRFATLVAVGAAVLLTVPVAVLAGLGAAAVLVARLTGVCVAVPVAAAAVLAVA